MASIEPSIEVNVPVRTGYNQWTQFEECPRFMEGVESVRPLDDKRLQLRANIGGKTKEWVAEITARSITAPGASETASRDPPSSTGTAFTASDCPPGITRR